MTTHHIDDAAVRDAAYFLWLEAGQPEGRDQELWFRAESALTAPIAKPKAKRKPAAKAAAPKAKAAPKAAAKTKTASAKKPRKAATAN